MKFFVDSAEIAEIKELASYGLLDGVTTNPSLIAKSGCDFKEVIAEICSVVSGPVSAGSCGNWLWKYGTRGGNFSQNR